MAEPATTNYSLPLRTAGLQAFKHSYKAAMAIIDTQLNALAVRVTAIEGGLDDSNSQFIDNND